MNMKLTNGLLGLGALLVASQINAATIFEATNADINIAATTGGGTFAMFDNEADLNAGLPAFTLGISQGDLIVVDPVPPASTTSLLNQMTGSSIAITNSNFVFGAFNAGSWILGTGTELFSPGSNLWDITFQGINPEIKIVVDIQAVPVPAAVWLFGSGLIGLVGVARRKNA